MLRRFKEHSHRRENLFSRLYKKQNRQHDVTFEFRRISVIQYTYYVTQEATYIKRITQNDSL